MFAVGAVMPSRDRSVRRVLEPLCASQHIAAWVVGELVGVGGLWGVPGVVGVCFLAAFGLPQSLQIAASQVVSAIEQPQGAALF